MVSEPASVTDAQPDRTGAGDALDPLVGPQCSLAVQLRRASGEVIGRSSELDAIAQEIREAAGRLCAVTVEGEPGIGKTRLLLAALELASASGFTCVARLMFWVKPIPAAQRIGRCNLLRISNQKIILVAEIIHARKRGEVFHFLHTAMQHQHEWHWLLFAVSGCQPQFIITRAERVLDCSAGPTASVGCSVQRNQRQN